jgi:uncharacterized 2Fe-2S/4Fe-4S cluster protein (DUF4445 family)
MPTIHFTNQATRLDVPAGTSLLEAVRRAGVELETPCEGTGTCGKCRVRLSQATRSQAHEADHDSLTQAERADGLVLACLTTVEGDVEVGIETPSAEGFKILSEGQQVAVKLSPWITKILATDNGQTRVLAGDQILTTEPGDTTDYVYGLAIDIGTTTLVVALNDLRTGRELGVASGLNPQARHGQDVLSRIKLGSSPEGLQTLHGELIRELNHLIGELTQQTGLLRDNIYEAVFGGNTTMLHLAVGANPASLGKYPYTPAIVGGNHVSAQQVGLELAPSGLVYLPPIISAYVGADITAGILATSLETLSGVTLFVDIGTNGEMVLAVNGKLTATSTAAGPAFEGMNIACGMRAGRGAVEQVIFTATGVDTQTIGNLPAIGICGSGLLDAVGEMAAHQAVDKNGRFRSNGAAEGTPWKDHWTTLDGTTVFRISGPVYLSQKDIRQVQLAKAAIRTGIDLMLRANHLVPAQVDRVLIAGSFGFHLRTPSLIHLGMLPREFADKVKFVGNTSKTGAQALLLSQHARTQLSAVAKDVRSLELANDDAFQKLFIQALSF